MNCQEARLHIEDALDKSLSGSVKRRLDLHLQHCAECRAFFEAEKAEFVRWYAAVNNASEHAHSLPSDFADRLVAAVTAPRPMPFFLRMPRWALVAASLAVMAMGTLFAAFVVEKVMSSFAEEPATVEEVSAAAPFESETPQSAPPDDQPSGAYAFQSPFDEYTQSESGGIADVISTNTHTTQTDAESASEIENKEGNGNMNMNKLIAVAAVAASAVSSSWAADGTWVGGTSTDLCEPLNWSDGVLPTDNASICLATAGTLTCSGTFSPKSITFPSDSTEVTIDGAGSITGIRAITNLAAAHHVFNCEVVCADGITPDITRGGGNYMTFAGGITMYNAPKTGGAVQDCWSGKITITTTDAQNYTSDNKNYIRLVPSTGTTFTFDNGCIDRMDLDPGATAVVNRLTYQGCRRSWKSGNQTGYFSLVFDTGNGVLRAGEIKSTTDAVLFHSYAGFDMVGGTIIADKLTCATTTKTGGAFPYPVFMLNCGAVAGAGVSKDEWNGEGVWVIGPGGLAFGETVYEGSHFETKIGKSLGGRPAATLHSFADWTLQSSPNGRNAVALSISSDNSGFLAIDTSHYAIGDARYDSATSHTVTLDGMVHGIGPLRVEGNGKVVFANEYSAFPGGLTVINTATASVKAGCKLGSGAVTLATGTTLEVAESGTATVDGALTLAEGAALAFNFTEKAAAPVLAVATPATLPATVNVKVSAAEGVRPRGGHYTLTSGGAFTGANVSLVDKPNWVKGVSVVNGDIVLDVKFRGVFIFVK